jgi:hypothetical protein
MKTRQLLDQLFETEVPKKDVRFDPEHYKRMGFSDEEAREQVRRAQNPRDLKTVQRHRGYGDDEPRQEANYHSPEERAVLKKVAPPTRMDKLRARRDPDSVEHSENIAGQMVKTNIPFYKADMPRAKAMLMAMPTVQGRGQS